MKTSVFAFHFIYLEVFVQKWIYHLDLVENLLGYILYFWFGHIWSFHILKRFKLKVQKQIYKEKNKQPREKG